MRNQKRRWMAVVSLVSLFLVGCDSARSVQPLSNEETSTLDERLIGAWDAADQQQDAGTGIFWIGKKQGSKKALELVTVAFNEDKTLETVRVPMFVRHGQANYLSVDLASLQKEWDATGPSWYFFKYEMPDDRTVILYAPKIETLREAVRQGRLKGTLLKPRPFWLFGLIPVTGPLVGDAVLEDSPEKIVGFLDKQKDAWMDETMVYKKVRLSRGPKRSTDK
jgi:hypothetical protein